jgi:hypothetical protein
MWSFQAVEWEMGQGYGLRQECGLEEEGFGGIGSEWKYMMAHW